MKASPDRFPLLVAAIALVVSIGVGLGVNTGIVSGALDWPLTAYLSELSYLCGLLAALLAAAGLALRFGVRLVLPADQKLRGQARRVLLASGLVMAAGLSIMRLPVTDPTLIERVSGGSTSLRWALTWLAITVTQVFVANALAGGLFERFGRSAEWPTQLAARPAWRAVAVLAAGTLLLLLNLIPGIPAAVTLLNTGQFFGMAAGAAAALLLLAGAGRRFSGAQQCWIGAGLLVLGVVFGFGASHFHLIGAPLIVQLLPQLLLIVPMSLLTGAGLATFSAGQVQRLLEPVEKSPWDYRDEDDDLDAPVLQDATRADGPA